MGYFDFRSPKFLQIYDFFICLTIFIIVFSYIIYLTSLLFFTCKFNFIFHKEVFHSLLQEFIKRIRTDVESALIFIDTLSLYEDFQDTSQTSLSHLDQSRFYDATQDYEVLKHRSVYAWFHLVSLHPKPICL